MVEGVIVYVILVEVAVVEVEDMVEVIIAGPVVHLIQSSLA